MKLTCLSCGQINRIPAERIDQRPKCAVCGAVLIPDRPVEIDGAILAKAVRNDDMPLVVDFWAPWCGPCRAMAPAFAQAAGTMKGKVRLVKVNTEAEPGTGARHAIRAIPTMVKFAGGREAKRQSGAVSAAAIVAFCG